MSNRTENGKEMRCLKDTGSKGIAELHLKLDSDRGVAVGAQSSFSQQAGQSGAGQRARWAAALPVKKLPRETILRIA